MVSFSTVCRTSMEYYFSLNSPGIWIPKIHKKIDLLNIYLVFWILIQGKVQIILDV